MSKCTQCQDKADLHISWNVEGNSQQCEICSSCLSFIWNGGGTDASGKKLHGFKNTQFGQSLTITPLSL